MRERGAMWIRRSHPRVYVVFSGHDGDNDGVGGMNGMNGQP